MKSSTYYVHMKTKILAEFQICISVPLISFSTFCFVENTFTSFIAKLFYLNQIIWMFRSLFIKIVKTFFSSISFFNIFNCSSQNQIFSSADLVFHLMINFVRPLFLHKFTEKKKVYFVRWILHCHCVFRTLFLFGQVLCQLCHEQI